MDFIEFEEFLAEFDIAMEGFEVFVHLFDEVIIDACVDIVLVHVGFERGGVIARLCEEDIRFDLSDIGGSEDVAVAV